MRSKGITTNYSTDQEIIEYLTNNTYFYKIASYRKNYDKFLEGSHKGQYIGLDFEYLKDLAIIDMHLRELMLVMTINIEHYTKLKILNLVEEKKENTYEILEDFKNNLPIDRQQRLLNELERNQYNTYAKGLYARYGTTYPLCAFLEVISFGTLNEFVLYLSKRYQMQYIKDIHFLLKSCKNIRNAAAHGSPILNDLHTTKPSHAHHEIKQSLNEIPSLTARSIRKKLRNIRIKEIVTVLYTHKILVSSKGIDEHISLKLNHFVKRLNRNQSYYQNNDLLRSNFNFLTTVIEFWYKV